MTELLVGKPDECLEEKHRFGSLFWYFAFARIRERVCSMKLLRILERGDPVKFGLNK